MKNVKVIDEIKIFSESLIYRVFEEQNRNILSYGLELEHKCNGEVYCKVFYNVADNIEYVLKMSSVFAENAVFPEALEEIAEEYICNVKT